MVIGNKVDMTQVEAIASAADPQFIMNIANFASLPYIVTDLAAALCQGEATLRELKQ